ncbi:MAG: hypothetical protein KatS3mg014_2777 [Actinomycetota bacterium]|nr:MAG: hypothetical protein KatS3mg014_2777 [Actinomycetota bacterium]
MARKGWVIASAIAATLVLAACGGGGGGGEGGGGGGTGGQTLSVTATEFKFEPNALQAPAGTDVTISVTDAGTIEHDFTIDEAGLKIAVKPGETKTGTVNLEAGTYTFYCSVPGHREAGMEGTLTVS